MDFHQKLLVCIDQTSREAAREEMRRWGEQHGYEHLIEKVLLPVMHTFNEECFTIDSPPVARGYVAAKIFEDGMMLVARQRMESRKKIPAVRGPVVLGNIEDDFHALGRRLVRIFLELDGWKVIDLENDVPAEEFVDAAESAGARVIGISAMMYSTARNIRKVRRELNRRGLENDIRLAVGGAVFLLRPTLLKEVGGDGTVSTAMGASRLFERLWREVAGKPSVSADRSDISDPLPVKDSPYSDRAVEAP